MNRDKAIILLVHWFIIIWILLTIINGAYQVSFVYTVEGQTWPLLSSSASLDYETMMIRRAYAIETWIATCGLCIYLAITEINPRLKKIRESENR